MRVAWVFLYIAVFVAVYNALDLLRLRWHVLADDRSRPVSTPRERALALAAIVVSIVAVGAAGRLVFPIFDRAYEAGATFMGVGVAVGIPGAILLAKLVSALQQYRRIGGSRLGC